MTPGNLLTGRDGNLWRRQRKAGTQFSLGSLATPASKLLRNDNDEDCCEDCGSLFMQICSGGKGQGLIKIPRQAIENPIPLRVYPVDDVCYTFLGFNNQPPDTFPDAVGTAFLNCGSCNAPCYLQFRQCSVEGDQELSVPHPCGEETTYIVGLVYTRTTGPPFNRVTRCLTFLGIFDDPIGIIVTDAPVGAGIQCTDCVDCLCEITSFTLTLDITFNFSRFGCQNQTPLCHLTGTAIVTEEPDRCDYVGDSVFLGRCDWFLSFEGCDCCREVSISWSTGTGNVAPRLQRVSGRGEGGTWAVYVNLVTDADTVMGGFIGRKFSSTGCPALGQYANTSIFGLANLTGGVTVS